jgi:transposase
LCRSFEEIAMPTTFRPYHPDQGLLLPSDLRDWLPEGHLAHHVSDLVDGLDLAAFYAPYEGDGRRKSPYEPRMMLKVLIYGYATGVFSSRGLARRLEEDVAFRVLAAGNFPSHRTICEFRRRHLADFKRLFVEVVRLAGEMGVAHFGKLSIDGTKVRANASKRNSIRHDRASVLREQLRGEIDDLLGAAERADVQDAPEPQSLPEELKRRETLKAKLDKACAQLERRAKSRADSERAEYERKVAAREQREGRRKGKRIKPPEEEPRDEEQINLTDSDSALMRKNKRSEYRQCYNAQAVVDAEGSQLVLGSRVSTCASDRGELVADVDSMPGALGSPGRVLADNGYATGTEVAELESRGLEVLVAVGTEDRRRAHDFRPPAPEKPVKEPQADWLKRMREKMSTDESRAHYRLRKQTVEPVFGIVKEAMGFRQFLLRGLEKVEAEWALVTLAYNCKRLNNMRLA